MKSLSFLAELNLQVRYNIHLFSDRVWSTFQQEWGYLKIHKKLCRESVIAHFPPIMSMVNLKASCTLSGWPWLYRHKAEIIHKNYSTYKEYLVCLAWQVWLQFPHCGAIKEISYLGKLDCFIEFVQRALEVGQLLGTQHWCNWQKDIGEVTEGKVASCNRNSEIKNKILWRLSKLQNHNLLMDTISNIEL